MIYNNLFNGVSSYLDYHKAQLFPIRFPNINYATQTTAHNRLDILPAETVTVGLNGTQKNHGLIQISVYVPKGSAAHTASLQADKILELFPRNLTIGCIRIDKAGYVSPPIVTDAWYVIPVTIPYVIVT